jgi:uncharacterized protein (TIGR02285 family)
VIKGKFRVALFFLWALLFAKVSSSQEDIVWYRPDFPPANFVDGLMEGLGYNDQTQKFLAQYLTQYQHNNAIASYKRVLHNIRYSKGCVIGLYKNQEREKYLVYSMASLVVFPNGLVVKEKDYQKFSPYIDQSSFISLDKLIKDKTLKVGVADGRSYGEGIDLLVKKHRSDGHLLNRSGQNVFTSLLYMLDRSRIDYMFGFPEELEYSTSLGILQNKMRFIPIKEMPEFEETYIACSKNIWGQQVITDINQILKKYRAKPEYLRFYEFWLDFDSKKRHHQLSLKLYNN